MRPSGLRVEHVEIEIGEPFAFGDTDRQDVIRYAALGSPPGVDDRLEAALIADAALRGIVLPAVTHVSYHAAGSARQVSITTLRDARGERLRIARGNPRAVVESLVHPNNAERARALTANARLLAEAYRPLAVAVQRGEGTWELLGYLPVRAWTLPERRKGRSFDYHPVWDLWLRVAHWSWVAAIAVLTVTGYFISEPQWVPTGWAEGLRSGQFISIVRLIHLLAAVVLMLVLLVRIWNLSTSKIPYDRWRALVPFRNRREVRNLFETLRAYLFIRADTAPEYFGHNPLQQLTYTLMYVIFLVQVLTGLALWGLYDSQSWFWGAFQWLNDVMGTQQVRLLHYVVMWMILLFLPLHVYLSIRADSVERSGAISSMVSGGRWVRRGAEFEDWPLHGVAPRPGRRELAPSEEGVPQQGAPVGSGAPSGGGSAGSKDGS